MTLNLKLKALLSRIASVFNVSLEGSNLVIMVRSEQDAQTIERWLAFGKFGSEPVISRGPKLERHQYWIVKSTGTDKALKALQGI